MKFFDLHCDTLYRVCTEGESLAQNTYHVSVERGMKSFSKWKQCFAIWIPDEVRGEDALQLFIDAHDRFVEDLKGIKSSDVEFLFTVENGSALMGDIKNIELLKKFQVRAMTLTWNDRNELGDGVMVENSQGITDFGKKCVHRMAANNIAIDVSHASEKLFWDVFEQIDEPGEIIATHSNAKALCSHVRNLTDEQFKVLRDKNGLVGVTFCDLFLRDGGNAKVKDILRHVEHFLSLGGEDVLAIGSDFDGTDFPADMKPSIEAVPLIYEMFLRENYNESLLKKIFFENADDYFSHMENNLQAF